MDVTYNIKKKYKKLLYQLSCNNQFDDLNELLKLASSSLNNLKEFTLLKLFSIFKELHINNFYTFVISGNLIFLLRI